MPRSLKPPRGIFTGTRMLFDRDLSPNIKETLLQLMALTWGNDFHFTPPLTYALLEDLTGKDCRTLRGHLRSLRHYHAALRSQYAGDGRFVFFLASWLFQNDLPMGDETAGDDGSAGGESLPEAVKEEEEEVNPDLNDSDDLNLLLLNDQADQSPANRRPGEVPKPPGGRRSAGKAESISLDPEVQAILVKAGVFPVLLPEVARRAKEGPYTNAELLALLAWCRAEQPENAAKLFIGRLRAGARAPAPQPPESDPPCPRCGRAGGDHAAGCPRRYLMDEP